MPITIERLLSAEATPDQVTLTWLRSDDGTELVMTVDRDAMEEAREVLARLDLAARR